MSACSSPRRSWRLPTSSCFRSLGWQCWPGWVDRPGATGSLRAEREIAPGWGRMSPACPIHSWEADLGVLGAKAVIFRRYPPLSLSDLHQGRTRGFVKESRTGHKVAAIRSRDDQRESDENTETHVA